MHYPCFAKVLWCRARRFVPAGLVLLVLLFGGVPPASAAFGDCADPAYRSRFDARLRDMPYDCIEVARVTVTTADGPRDIRLLRDRHGDWATTPEVITEFVRGLNAVPAAAAQLGIPPERIVLGGFSQGGIMALSQLLTQPQTLRGVLVWHSRLLPEIASLHAPAAAFAGKSAWVSHGSYGNVIPLTSAHAVRDRLAALPLQLSYHEYPGAHEIRPEELRASMQWLQDLTVSANDFGDESDQ